MEPTVPPPAEDLVMLLNELCDAVEPAPVSMMPATWSWAVLAALLFVLLAVALWTWARNRRRTAYRRAALAELTVLAPSLARGDVVALGTLDRLIRRVALVAFPRAEVATLSGLDWIAFLDRTGGAFAPFATTLITGPYVPRPLAFDGPGLVGAARHWIARHHA